MEEKRSTRPFDVKNVILDLFEDRQLLDHLTLRRAGFRRNCFDRKDGKGRRHFVARITEHGLQTCYGERLVLGDPKFFEKFNVFCDKILGEF